MSLEYIDSHCHIHDESYGLDLERVFGGANEAGVRSMICIGTDESTSQKAVDFAKQHENCWATVGLHPHDAKLGEDTFEIITQLATEKKVVGIGECGLDYFYEYSPKKDQKLALEYQLQLALSYNLPVSFHVREAFEDFWPIFDNFTGLRGVLHSFTATQIEMEEALKRDLYLGFNGIMTFTKDEEQLLVAKTAPIERILLETDAPYLTPKPYRGKMNEPKNVAIVAEFLAKLRGENLEEFALKTSRNTTHLFGI